MRLGENQRFRWFRFHVAGALALLFFPVMAAAVVLFDARLGIGMVDAVDLVRLLSWSEQDLAQRHMTLRFNYQGTERYQVVCSGQGAAGGPRTNEIRMLERKVSFRVIALPMFDDQSGRRLRQFQLSGRDSSATEVEPLPTNGQPCASSAGSPGIITGVVRHANSGGLYVDYPGGSVRLSVSAD